MNVHLRGVGERLHNSLRFLFDSNFSNQVSFVDKGGDITIVDLDVPGVKDDLGNYVIENPDQVIVLLSIKNMMFKSDTNILFLRKPFTSAQMVDTLKRAQTKVQSHGAKSTPNNELYNWNQLTQNTDEGAQTRSRSHSSGSTQHVVQRPNQPNVTAAILKERNAANNSQALDSKLIPAYSTRNNRSESKDPFSHLTLSGDSVNTIIDSLPGGNNKPRKLRHTYAFEKSLSGIIFKVYQRAVKRKSLIKLSVRNNTFLLDPERKSAWVDMVSLRDLTFITSPIIKTWTSYTIVPNTEQTKHQRGKLMSIEALIWETAIYGAAGRVPEKTNLNSPVVLKHWPNLTRLLIFPEALRIAAILSEGTYSLNQAVRLLKIEPKLVFTFYSAAYALGLIGEVSSDKLNDEVDTQKLTLPRSQKRTILNSIFKRLKASITREKS